VNTLPRVDTWFKRRRIDDTITLLWEPHVIELMRCNIWHVRGRDRDLVIDTGDRHFEVLHLPGHSPGSIGLWEERSGTLFSGDAIYDGPLPAFRSRLISSGEISWDVKFGACSRHGNDRGRQPSLRYRLACSHRMYLISDEKRLG
jgi:glyoxylase-like metal-dependent hydrolase (beta-lactamase superfamily II)